MLCNGFSIFHDNFNFEQIFSKDNDNISLWEVECAKEMMYFYEEFRQKIV